MDIETVHKKYKFLILNTLTGESELLSSDRLVSKNLKDKYWFPSIDTSNVPLTYTKRLESDASLTSRVMVERNESVV